MLGEGAPNEQASATDEGTSHDHPRRVGLIEPVLLGFAAVGLASGVWTLAVLRREAAP
jgi:hypothetical protein